MISMPILPVKYDLKANIDKTTPRHKFALPVLASLAGVLNLGKLKSSKGFQSIKELFLPPQTDGIPETIQVPYTLGDTRNFSLKWYF